MLNSKRRKSHRSSKRALLWTLILISLLCACQPAAVTAIEPTPPLAAETKAPAPTDEALFSILLSPCDLIDRQFFYDTFQDSTLFFTFEEGRCAVRNQWDTKSIRFGVAQGDQAGQAARWYAKKTIKNWSTPELLEQFNDLFISGETLGLADFLNLNNNIYTMLEFREERLFSVGDTSFWYTLPLAKNGILEAIHNDQYVRIDISGFFSEEALGISETLADMLFEALPERFSVNHNFGELELIDLATPTADLDANRPFILTVAADQQNIFFGDLCGNERTTIFADIPEHPQINRVYLVYRLTSAGETNVNYITRQMNKVSEGLWSLALSAERDFTSYSVVNGARVEYAISIVYGISGVVRSPYYSDVRVNQCTAGG